MKTIWQIYTDIIKDKFTQYKYELIGHDQLSDLIINPNDLCIIRINMFHFLDFQYTLCTTLVDIYEKLYLCDSYGISDLNSYVNMKNQYIYSSFKYNSKLYVCEYNINNKYIYIFDHLYKLLYTNSYYFENDIKINQLLQSTFIKMEAFTIIEKML